MSCFGRNRSIHNPLLGWEKPDGLTPRNVNVVLAPVIASNAKQRFAEAMAKSDSVLRRRGIEPFPIFVNVLAPGQTDWTPAAEAAKQAKCLLINIPVSAHQGKESLEGAPGHPLRTTPVTPFNMFHQLEHDLTYLPRRSASFNGALSDLSWVSKQVNDAVEKANLNMARAMRVESGKLSPENKARLQIVWSLGVNTQAGRMGALVGKDAEADIFAKYCTASGDLFVDLDEISRVIDEVVEERFGGRQRGGRLSVEVVKAREDLFSAKTTQLAMMEVKAAFQAGVLSMFIQGYYNKDRFHPMIPRLSEFTRLTLGEEEDETFSALVGPHRAKQAPWDHARNLLSVMPKPEDRPVLFVNISS